VSQANTVWLGRTLDKGSAPLDSRVAFVDYAKGWCIVLVVMMHSTLGLTERVGTTGWLSDFIAFARPFRMPDFFLLAGLFAMRSLHAPLRSFVDGKVLHFAYFYVVWMTLQLLSKRAGILVSDPVQFGHEYLWGLVEPFGTLWFIYVLPLMYLCARLLRSVPTIPILIFACAVGLLELRTAWTAIDYLAAYFVFFLAGVRLSGQVLSFAERCTAHPFLTACALTLWALANAWAVHMDVASGGLTAIALGAMGALAVVAGSALLARANVLVGLRYAGEHSLAIYLAFFLPMIVTRLILLKFEWVWSVDFAAITITTIAIVLPLGGRWLSQGTRLKFLFERPHPFRIKCFSSAPSRRGMTIVAGE
jgi:uncharacterized membrane protein YcfT